MYFNMVAFNFKSADIEAEERNYFDHHVALAKQMTGLRFYYTSRMMASPGRKPERFRVAILGFDDAAGASAAFSSPVIPEILADTRDHICDLISKSAAGETIVPFESRKPGDRCFVMAAEFDLAEMPGGLDAADNRYRTIHVPLAKQMPGLRHYVIAKNEAGAGPAPDRYRTALLTFDSLDAMRAAYRSPIGQNLVRDEEATIRNARVWRLDARVEL